MSDRHPINSYLITLLVISCSVFSCLGGGGGGDESATSTSGDPGPGGGGSSSAQSNYGLLLDGPAYAQTGSPYQARAVFLTAMESGVDLFGSEDEEEGFTLAGPPGMSVDANSGLVSWTPSPGQEGDHTITMSASDGVGTSTETAVLPVQGSRLEASASIAAASGGTVEVVDPASGIHGTRLIVPPGAMAQDATVEIRSLANAVVLPPGPLGLELLPSQNFFSPVTVELVYSDAWLASTGIADESKLADSAVDAAANRITATTTHFSFFTAFADDPYEWADGNPAAMAELEAAWKLYVGGSAGAPSTEQLLAMESKLWQPRVVEHLKGFGFKRKERNALLIHGLFSHRGNFPELNAYALARYDNVVFYNYPSGMSIRQNALWLANYITLEPGVFEPGSSVDVYAHSMGGLVARSIIEDPVMIAVRILTPFVSVNLIATPNLGGDVTATVPSWMKAKLSPGMADLLPGSPLQAWLNGPNSQGFAKYHGFAGNLGSGNDGWVAVGSALPSGIMTWSDALIVPGQNHSDLHLNMNLNGIAAELNTWYAPKVMKSDSLSVIGQSLTVINDPLDPFEFDTEYEEVIFGVTIGFGPDFFVPPYFPVVAVLRPTGEFAGCWDPSDEPEKSALYIDDSFPEMNEAMSNYPQFLTDDPDLLFRVQTSPNGSQITLTRRERNVPACWSSESPELGVNAPFPDTEIWLYIGDEQDPFVLAGPF